MGIRHHGARGVAAVGRSNNVEIVRSYARIEGAVVPVSLESNAHVRFLGPATLRMTYVHPHIDGRDVGASVSTP